MRCDPHDRPRRVLVTGVGGAPAFDLTRCLLRHGCAVIGTDASPYAPGLLLPGITAETSPAATDPGYQAAVLDLCRRRRPDALLSTVEAELTQLVQLRGELEDLGVRTWLPHQEGVAACTDKARFHTVLTRHDIPTPTTYLPSELNAVPVTGRLVVKPRHGQGAQHVYFCTTRAQAKVLCELVPEPIIQNRVAGQEFTADCLVDRNGRASVILRYRLLVKGGLAVLSRTFHDDEVAARVRETLAAVGAVGACCAQGFICDNDAPERVVMTEVNARIAGGFLLSEAAGADLAGQILNGLVDRPVDHDRLTYRSGITLTKYTETLATNQPNPSDQPLTSPPVQMEGTSS